MDIKQFIEKGLSLLKGAWRYRWFGLIASLIIAIVGWVAIGILPNYYRANAKIYIDTQSLLQPLMRDISVSLDPDFRIQKMTKMLFSTPNIERIARMSDLDLQYTTKREREEFLKKLEYDIQFQQQGRSNLFVIGYDHQDPEVAKLVVQSILNLFMELTLSDTRTDTVVAQKFLDEQIGSIEQRLVDAEQNLAKFKRSNMAALPRQDLTYYESLQALLMELEQTKRDIAIETSKQTSLEKQLRGEEPVLGMSSSGDLRALHPLFRQLNQLEENYKNLTQVYTGKHPDVMRVKAQINALQMQIDNESGDSAWVMTQDELNKNPVYQQIKIQLSEVTSNLASLKAKEAEITKQAAIMEEKVDSIIETEAKLSNLNRDYRMNQQQYQALLAKREAARFAEEIDDTAENLKFKIVDPAYVLSSPIWPNRNVFNFAVLMASLVAGFATSLALSQLKPAFFDRVSLEQYFGSRVLATIPFERTQSFTLAARRQTILMAAGVMVLFAGFILLYLLTAAGAV